MSVKTASEILKSSSVTSEQIGKAHKVFAEDKTAFYLVENSKGEVDAEGLIIEYRVTWSRERGFSCTCEAGQEGFIHCSRGYCWHVAAAVACAKEEREAMEEQSNVTPKKKADREHDLIINGKVADAKTYARIVNAKPKFPPELAPAPFQARPFKFMR